MPRLLFLGGARLEVDGRVAAGPATRRHPIALLAVLATAPEQRASRGTLATLLWPEAEEAAARNRLSTVVYQIREALGPGALVTAGNDLVLERGSVNCDVWELRAALDADRFEDVVERYTGAFLDGFTPPASVALERRLERERRRLRDEYRTALERLARGAEEAGRPREAVGWWQRLVDEDPLDGRLTMALMRAFVRSGNRAGALRAAERHGERLEEELGAPADPEVAQLARTLRQPAAATEDRAAGDRPRRGIAVLPFAVDRPDREEARTFADGIHDELITELSRSPTLPVISRRSVLRYANGGGPAPEIGASLGVRYLVEGTVQHAGGRVRVRIKLVDSIRDRVMWAESYDRDRTAEALFTLQSELVRNISTAVRAELDDTPRGTPTPDMEAYRLYVSGRTLMEQRSHASLQRALDLFGKAVDLDPEYPEAWAALGEALALLVSYEQLPLERAEEAVDAAHRALELREDLAEAHVTLGFAHMGRQDAQAAAAALRRALELRPGYAAAHGYLAFLVLPLGFADEGMSHMEQAARLDPYAPEYQWGLGYRYFTHGLPVDEALSCARRARELAPAYAEAALLEGQILSAAGRTEPALRVLRHGLEEATLVTRPRHLAATVEALATGGRGTEARALAEQIPRDRAPFYLAVALSVTGRVDEAFDILRDHAWKPGHCAALRYEPALAGVRDDPRYRELLDAMESQWGLIRETAPGGSLP